MIKASKYFIIAALAVMILAGCTDGETGPDSPGRSGCPSFSATISGEASASRAYDQSWDSGDEIGVSGASRTNVAYVTSDGSLGSFTVKTIGAQIYYPDDKEVTFTAYYPWRALSAGAVTIQADTRMQLGQKSFDFLWAQASGKMAAPEVEFDFVHRMAKVVISLIRADDMTFDELKAARLSLKGIRHKGTFDVTDGTASATDAPVESDWVFTDDALKAPVILDGAAGTATYTFIIFPQQFAEALEFTAQLSDGKTFGTKIDFSDANREKDGAVAGNQLVAGRQYNLNLTLYRNLVLLAKCVINPWNEVEGEVVAD